MLVYALHRAKTDETIYVGISCGAYRPTRHAKEAIRGRHGNKHLQNVICRDIADGHGLPRIEIVEHNLSDELAKSMEVRMIAEIGRADLGRGPLLNLTDGGEGARGYVYPQEARERRSLAQKGKGKTPEHAAAISAGKKGICTASDAQRRAVRDRMLGSKMSAETRKKMSDAHKTRALLQGKNLREEADAYARSLPHGR